MDLSSATYFVNLNAINPSSVNFNQLKYILSVDKHRNFSRASEECGIAQSTLSKEIQRLEQEFGIIIFDRSRYPVTPTLKGIDLIDQGKTILNARDQFVDIAQKTHNRPVGEFHLGILPTLAPYLLPLFINSLSEKYPDLSVQIHELTSQEMLVQFEEDSLDGAIGISPFIRDGYYEEFLYKEKFVLYLDAQHDLAQQENIQWKDLPFDELILHETFKGYLLSSGELRERAELSENRLHNVDYLNGSLETLRKIIDRNGGMTLLPSLSTLYMGERRLQMVRPIVDPVLSRDISFITPRGFEMRRLTKVIKKEIKAGLPRNQ